MKWAVHSWARQAGPVLTSGSPSAVLSTRPFLPPGMALPRLQSTQERQAPVSWRWALGLQERAWIRWEEVPAGQHAGETPPPSAASQPRRHPRNGAQPLCPETRTMIGPGN